MEDKKKKDRFLMVATVASMIGQFNMDNINILLNMGYEVHVACNFNDESVWTKKRIQEFKEKLLELDVKIINIDFARDPLNISKLVASYCKLQKLIKDEGYKALHCHTPVASVVARIATIFSKTKVIYTAHGFHFFEGAPLKNWIIYYPLEKICSLLTDVLITINKEDYNRAKGFWAKKVEYVPGVGIDVEKIDGIEVDRRNVRNEIGVSEDDYIILSVGELSVRKNHEVVIRALKHIDNCKVKYIMCGVGEREQYLQDLVNQLGLQERVLFAGYRKNVYEILHAVDCFAFPSLQEGLPVALMEAMAVGLPIVCSKIRGNVDLVVDGENGYLCEARDVNAFSSALIKLMNTEDTDFKNINVEKIKLNDINLIRKKMKEIYSSLEF